MTEATLSVRIDKEIHEQMKLHEQMNWSAILRRSVVEQLEKLNTLDKEKAKKAAIHMDALRKAHAFDRGKSSVEVIRTWREKRR